MTRKSLALGCSAVALGLLGVIQAPGQAAAANLLGSAANFAVLASSTVTNAGPTTIVGNVGVYPGTAIAGFGTVSLTGTLHAGDPVAQQAEADAATAYGTLAGLPVTQNLTGMDLGGLTLGAGVYKFNSTAQLSGALELNFAGMSNENVIFQIGSTLTSAANSSVMVEGGNATDNVYFQVGSSAVLGNDTAFVGNILALASITLNDGTSIVDGRAIALNGAVTLNSNSIGVPAVSPVPLPGALPLFGAAIAGLAGFGIARARRRSA
jgi:type VI secretion system secreted protein VgrG